MTQATYTSEQLVAMARRRELLAVAGTSAPALKVARVNWHDTERLTQQ